MRGLKRSVELFVSALLFCFTATLWRGALPAVQSKELLIKQRFLIIYRGLVARGPAGSAIKRIADEAILSDLMPMQRLAK